MQFVFRHSQKYTCSIWAFSQILTMQNQGPKIATHWSPMRPKIEHWRLNFQNWSPAGDSRFVR